MVRRTTMVDYDSSTTERRTSRLRVCSFSPHFCCNIFIKMKSFLAHLLSLESGSCSFNVAGPSISLLVTFWGYNAFLLYIDITGKPAFFQRYKIQEEKNVPVSELV